MSRLAFALVAVGMTFATAAIARGTLIDAADINNVRLGRDVILEGYVVEHIRDDYYKFRDDSGTIRIELDTWAGRRAPSPDTRVRIYGEVDRGWSTRYVSVERMTVLK